ncbi:hypothetical protein ACFY0A_32340 [Streptomyces sp. NPDC001698]|uniref:hypothetical protein n=1 Tax=Streptomyces sp. NPDC001698 TaxID=3364601 RepID=UPI003677613B
MTRRPARPKAKRSPIFEEKDWGSVPLPGALLDWRDGRHFAYGDEPCALCGKPAPLRSHAGESVHKACAESWIAANPKESRLGRFVSDAQPKRRDESDHA